MLALSRAPAGLPVEAQAAQLPQLAQRLQAGSRVARMARPQQQQLREARQAAQHCHRLWAQVWTRQHQAAQVGQLAECRNAPRLRACMCCLHCRRGGGSSGARLA